MVRHNERREDICAIVQLIIAIRLCPQTHKRTRRSRENAHRWVRTFGGVVDGRRGSRRSGDQALVVSTAPPNDRVPFPFRQTASISSATITGSLIPILFMYLAGAALQGTGKAPFQQYWSSLPSSVM